MPDRRPPRRPDTTAAQTVRIERMGERGMGIAHLPGGKALLVPYSAPGDLVTIRVRHETGSWAQGSIVEIRESSPDRVHPPCPWYGVCGGCSLQHVSYERQLDYKHAILEDVYRDCGVTVQPVEPSPRVLGYRNKLQMQTADVSGRLAAGFYRPRSHDIVAVDRCLLQSDAANALARDTVATLARRGVRAWKRPARGRVDGGPRDGGGRADRGGRGGAIRDLVIRESLRGELTLTLVTGVPRLREEDQVSRELFGRHEALRGFYLYHNPYDTEYVFRDGEHPGRDSRGSPLRRIHGRTFLESFAGLQLETSPITFFQVNHAQAERIVEAVRAVVGPGPRSVLVDAYAGVGSLSLPLAPHFRRIVAVESVRQSCELAQANAERNGVKGYRVLHGDVARVLQTALAGPVGHEGMEDGVILVDPPRTGLEGSVARGIARSGFPLVVYLSCDPRTQARDLSTLTREGPYRVRELRPFDMFPQTFHVECLAVLERTSR